MVEVLPYTKLLELHVWSKLSSFGDGVQGRGFKPSQKYSKLMKIVYI